MSDISLSPDHPEGIENLDEFDDASALSKAYCRQISVQEFENQASTETEKALQSLLEYIEGHNDVYMEVLKKRKQEEVENSGLFSYIKAKVLSTIQGDNYTGNQVDGSDFLRKKEQLKTGITRAFDYSQESKGRRSSKRLASKRRAQENDENSPIRGRPPLRRGSSKTPNAPPPPTIGTPMAPPPPPPLPCMTPLKDRNTLNNTPRSVGKPLIPAKWKGSTSSLASVSSVTSMDSIHSELLLGNPLDRLRATTHIRSPGGTPYPKRKSRSRLSDKDSLEKVLLSVMQQKFRNVRTPSPAGGYRNTYTSPDHGFSPASPY